MKSIAAAVLGAGLVAGVALFTVSPASSAGVVGVGSPAVASLFSSESRPDGYEMHSDHRVAYISPVNGLRTDLGGYSVDGVAAAFGDGFPEMVLVHGSDGAVWYRTRDAGTGAFSRWVSLGGRIISRPAVAGDGHSLLVAVRGADGRMYERVRGVGGGWSPSWRAVNSHFTGALAVAPRPGGGFVVYGQGTDGRLWTSTRGASLTSGWSGFRPVPTRAGLVLTEPAVDAVGGGLYVRGSDAACWWYDPANPSAGWRSLGGRFTDGFAAITGGQGGAVYVFGRGPDHELYIHISTTPGWEKYLFA